MKLYARANPVHSFSEEMENGMGKRMQRLQSLLILIALVLLLACGSQRARSEKSFDDIRDAVKGKTAAEVEGLLGKPDSRQPLVLSGERWIWWNYTYLDGNNYPPEMRGRVVHLEIIFERSGDAVGNGKEGLSDLRVVDPLAVSYTLSEPAR